MVAEVLQRIVDNLKWDAGRPERYWIPLLLLFQGCRLNEVASLYTHNVINVDEIWCLDIIGDSKDKLIKTKESERQVPLHPMLLQLGFIDFVELIKKKQLPRLWMNLQFNERTGYAHEIGKWLQRFNRSHVTSEAGKVIHSLRHNFSDFFKQAGVERSVVAELMGHSNRGDITFNRYGKRYKVPSLLKVLARLDYKLNLKNLFF